jgi:hypothetical protein
LLSSDNNISMHDVRCAIVVCVVCGAHLCIICGHHSSDNPSTTHVQSPQGLQVQQGHEVASKKTLWENSKLGTWNLELGNQSNTLVLATE